MRDCMRGVIYLLNIPATSLRLTMHVKSYENEMKCYLPSPDVNKIL